MNLFINVNCIITDYDDKYIFKIFEMLQRIFLTIKKFYKKLKNTTKFVKFIEK